MFQAQRHNNRQIYNRYAMGENIYWWMVYFRGVKGFNTPSVGNSVNQRFSLFSIMGIVFLYFSTALPPRKGSGKEA